MLAVSSTALHDFMGVQLQHPRTPFDIICYFVNESSCFVQLNSSDSNTSVSICGYRYLTQYGPAFYTYM